MIKEIENIKLEDWLSELKNYQKTSIESLISNYGEDEAIVKWLSAEGPNDTVPFGGNNKKLDSEPFLNKFKDEFKKFICDHPDYSEERKKLKSQSNITNAIFISVISAALGATLGFAATLLAPAVAIMLAIVGRIGVNAYCKN
ncbi:hypothetical protein GUB10_11590 [Salegentibacter sp. BLCTC]|uniref:hypothetical protein n=1 Tax=Salegentibacter sp. BLCTC TaxID=2697368 RepID=UPI00187B2C0D|nr:hypothetical protein [Salegentibacter sp. BLCTC]MBE7640976.1 hypothetical protein [Salegentibacter sp. BLCTC]